MRQGISQVHDPNSGRLDDDGLREEPGPRGDHGANAHRDVRDAAKSGLRWKYAEIGQAAPVP